MDKLIIEGPAKLKGTVTVSAAKNAYLPILAGVLLTDEEISFDNLPNLRDIRTMLKLLQNLGVETSQSDKSLTVRALKIDKPEATYDLVKTMRASICVLGPLLARFGDAKVSLPGGCAIGTRPIDIHLANLEKMGAQINLEAGYVHASTTGLKGAHLVLDFPSVGATENLMMAATLAEGKTVIENCALEPEVTDLANFLVKMGAKISGIGSKTLVIEGVKKLHGCTYSPIGDRIEAATYIIAGLMTESEITVDGFSPDHLDFVIEKLKGMGAKIENFENGVHIFKSKLKGVKLETAPYPGFPTDVQAQMIAMAMAADGISVVSENIFENRFMHIPELKRLGADIILKSNAAIIEGRKKLVAAPVMCTDLRASAALVLAALIAEGKTDILRVYHLDRGYDNLDKKLSDLGVKITRAKEEEV